MSGLYAPCVDWSVPRDLTDEVKYPGLLDILLVSRYGKIVSNCDY